MTIKQPLPNEWLAVFDDMVAVQQKTEAERDKYRAELESLTASIEVWNQAIGQAVGMAKEMEKEINRLKEENAELRVYKENYQELRGEA